VFVRTCVVRLYEYYTEKRFNNHLALSLPLSFGTVSFPVWQFTFFALPKILLDSLSAPVQKTRLGLAVQLEPTMLYDLVSL
jgi:hypothetical protein